MHDLGCRRCKWMVRLALAGWLLAPLGLAADGPCAGERFRDFDFWLGSWRVVDAEGAEAGQNRIESAQAGCLVQETWRGATGSTGTSLNFYDPVAAVWRQVWVSPGALIDISGGMTQGSMVLTGSIVYVAEGRSLPFRGTWTALPDGRVRQFFEEQRQAGVWTAWFEGFYEPMEAPPAGP